MSDSHENAVRLLPWYVNGSLPEHERAALERHLRDCLVCRAELNKERKLRTLVRAQPEQPPSPEHGIAELLHRIGRERARAAPRRLRPRLAYAATAACVGIAAWALLGGPLRPVAENDGAGFSTLTRPAADAGRRIDIVFTEETGREAIDQLIRSFDGRIVSGPSDVGRYTVSVPAPSDEALAAIIEDLAGRSGVRFVGRNFIAPAEAQSP